MEHFTIPVLFILRLVIVEQRPHTLPFSGRASVPLCKFVNIQTIVHFIHLLKKLRDKTKVPIAMQIKVYPQYYGYQDDMENNSWY